MNPVEKIKVISQLDQALSSRVVACIAHVPHGFSSALAEVDPFQHPPFSGLTCPCSFSSQGLNQTSFCRASVLLITPLGIQRLHCPLFIHGIVGVAFSTVSAYSMAWL